MGATDQIDYIIIIPLCNEAPILRKSVDLLLGFFGSWDKKSWKIILADNGSYDATGTIGREIAQTSNGRILYFYFPLAGRGNALRETVKKINSKFYLYVDADIPLPPEEIINFFKPLEEGEADLVVGKRVETKRPWLRRLLTISLRAVTNLFFGLKVSDALCGIKAMNKKASEILTGRCKEKGFILDAEFLIEAKRASLRTKETPIHWIDKRYSERESSLKMISDPVKALWALMKILYRN
jgi:glycosyltransferase involved in cell wall biosynthesis